MILDEIALHNFGLYADRQSLLLTPPSASKPIVLIGGLNGGGKTTLLDALQLCLYGPHARLSHRGSLAYPEYLARSIHRGAANPEAGLEVAFRHTVEGREDHYRLRRSWRVNGNGCKEHFEVIRNGRMEPALAENWFSQVEDLMPPNIAHLFLFDGEQIENYASLSNSSALIGSAIQNLLGLDIVDQLDKDLHIYERRKRVGETDDVSREKIGSLEGEIRALRERSTALTEERAALRSRKIDYMRKALCELEAQFRKMGGELYERRIEIETQVDEAKKEAEQQFGDLRELASSAMPLLLVRGLLQSAATRDGAEESDRRARETVKVLKERDENMLKHLRKEAFSKAALDAIKGYLDGDRQKRATPGKSRAVLDLSAEARADLHVLLRDQLAALAKDAASRFRESRHASAQAERLQQKFESIPGADTVAEIAEKREMTRSDLQTAEAELAVVEKEIERAYREIERKTLAVTQLLENNAKLEGERQDRFRILRHSSKVRDTLSAFRRSVAERHVRRIEQLVLESYKQLLRKESLVTGLKIDSESYSLILYGRDGMALNAERLSAGERQLLAIALLWGLAKASGRPLPTAIDTPLGRLDTDHRMHLIERYFPFASHQVILLSTDEEITGEYLQRLGPWIGRTYRLAYDDKAGNTIIQDGYFEVRQAA